MAVNEEQPPPSTAATEPPRPSSPSTEPPYILESSWCSLLPAQPEQVHSNMHIQAEQKSSVSAATAETSNITEQKGIWKQENIIQRQKSSPVRLAYDDGYDWVGSSEKRTMGFKFRRSFKCTTPNCHAIKNVEYTFEGRITALSYYREHNHHPRKRAPPNTISKIRKKYHEDPSRLREIDVILLDEMKLEAEYLSGASCEEVDEDIHHPKKWMYPSSYRTLTVPRFVEQRTSTVDIPDDGHRWLKYAETLVKDNPNPRRYYRCRTLFCNVIKHVQRSLTTPTDVLTTYEGVHNHPKPIASSYSSSIYFMD